MDGSGFTKKITVPQLNEEGVKIGDVEQDIVVQVGSYSYTAPDGQLIEVKYIADENGFQPIGAHLPTPPTVPEAIATSLNTQANSQQYQQQQQQQPQQRQFQQQNQFQQQSQFQQQQQQPFGQRQGRASSSEPLQNPQASNFRATTPVYPKEHFSDRFAEFSGGSL